MRRDDLRAVVHHDDHRTKDTHGNCWLCAQWDESGITETRRVSDAEALDAIGRDKALKHWLTDPCPDCETWALRRDGHSPNVCPRCKNHRWVPAKGVWIDEEINQYIDEIELAFIVPLSMLEGDDQ